MSRESGLPALGVGAATEGSLGRDRERLAVALRAANLGVYEWTIADERVWWSPEVYTIYGVDPLVFVPTVQAFTALIHPDDREELWRKSQECIARGEVFAHEYRIVRPDGEVRWIRNHSDVAFDPSGRVERITGVAFDVTQRRQDEHRLGIVISRIDDHLVTYDRQWRYTFVNAAAARMVGKTREELLGRSIWELFPDAVGNQYYRDLHAAVEAQQPIVSEHYYAPFECWFENRIYPSPDGVTVFATDISARKRAETQLRDSLAARDAAESALREANQRKDEFLAVLSHELRNPLGAMTNAVFLLKHAGGDPEKIRYTSDLLERQLSRMVRQVDDLLDLSRISGGKIDLRRDTVDVWDVVDRAIESTRALLDRSEHTLAVTHRHAPILISADASRLCQVVENLLTNAAKFTERGGHISLSVVTEDDEVVLRVQDSGIGISPDAIHRVFDMYTQLEAPLERSQTGLGVGLSLVKTLVELHGGSVTAFSEGTGRGSEFVVRIPLEAKAR